MHSFVEDKSEMKSRFQKGTENGKAKKTPRFTRSLQKTRVMGINCLKNEMARCG